MRAKIVIYDAAGDTKSPMLVTTRGEVVYSDGARMVLTARVAEGPLHGKLMIGTLVGTFNSSPESSTVESYTQKVDGELLCAMHFSDPIPFNAFATGHYALPFTEIGNRHDNALLGDNAGDRLYGGAGDDVLIGFRGADLLKGGAGMDEFAFLTPRDSTAARSDRIADFGRGIDLIDLQEIDANARAHGNQAFDFIGTHAFSGDAEELRVAKHGDTTVVLGDIDGDRVAELVIRLDHAPRLGEHDFIL